MRIPVPLPMAPERSAATEGNPRIAPPNAMAVEMTRFISLCFDGTKREHKRDIYGRVDGVKNGFPDSKERLCIVRNTGSSPKLRRIIKRLKFKTKNISSVNRLKTIAHVPPKCRGS